MSESCTHNAPPKAGLKAGKIFRKEESVHRYAQSATPFFTGVVSRDVDTEAASPDIQSLFIPGIHRAAEVAMKCADCEQEEKVQRNASEPGETVQAKCAECEAEEKIQRNASEPGETVQAKCAECEAEEKIQRNASEPEETVQAKCAECEEEEKVQRKETDPEEKVQAKCDDCESAEKLHTKPDEAATAALAPIQASLKVGKPDDPHEVEADRMAEKVLRMPQLSFTGGGGARPEGNSNNNIQRSEEEGEDILTKPVKGLQRAGDGSFHTSHNFSARLRTGEPGNPLPEPVKGNMESAFQADFSAVRIHTGTEAAALSQDIGAQAFAYQHHIYFAENKYRPESADGKFLLAHELTHTVQQGAARPAQRNETTTIYRDEADGAAPEPSWTDMLLNGAESVLQAHIPAELYQIYKDIKAQGVSGYFKGALFGLFRGLFNGLGFSDQEFMLIIQIFIQLKNQLPVILDGLSKGDCKPLFEALNLLSFVVKGIAGAVWDRVMAAIEPLRVWLNKIWDTYMAPALDKITAFAGDVWARIKDFGRWVWNKFYSTFIQPYVDAWNWMCKKLGIESSDEGGFIDFISAKLSAAWQEIKTQLRPVIEPIQAVVAGIGAMINMDAIRKLQEDATQWLDKVADTATTMGGEDDAVANKQLTLRDVLLPALNKSIDRIKVTIIAAGQWVLEKVNNIAVNVTTFFSGLQNNEYLSPVYALVSWVPKTIASVKDWAEDKVNWIFGRIYDGMEYVRAFMQRVVDMLLKLVAVAGNVLDFLGDFILGPLNLVPKCIKDPIMNWLTEVILKKIPVISEFIDLADKWPQIKAAALTVIKQVFVDGNLARGLWTYFRNLLSLLGIDPTLVTAVIAKAAHNFSDIIKKPGEFLKNVWNVIKGGFVRFYDNLGTHLLHGALEWLFGEVKGAVAVAPPADFTLGNILSYVLDLFGINMENVYTRMEENPRIGKERVSQIKRMQNTLSGALEWITVWIKEGAAGLLRKAQEKLDDLTDMVISGIVGWISQKISAEILKRLATSSDPLGIGATINTIILVYDTMKTGIAYVNRMLNLANQAMDNLAEIIGGKLEHAQIAFEEVLAKAVPVVIGFSVEVIIGPVGDKIKEIVTAGRNKVDEAIDWLINGALNVIDSLIKAGKAALNKVLGWLGIRKEFKAADGETHTLSFKGTEARAQLMIASTPTEFATWIKGVVIDDPKSKEGKILAKAKVDAQNKYNEIYTAENEPETEKNTKEKKEKKIKDLIDELSVIISPLFIDQLDDCCQEGKGLVLDPVNGSGYATKMTAMPLTKKNPPKGSTPSITNLPDSYKEIKRRKNSEGPYYVLGHLLNHNLGGTGKAMTNLTPLTGKANATHLHLVEENIKTAVDKGSEVEYNVVPNYGRDVSSALAAMKDSTEDNKDEIIKIITEEKNVAVSLDCEAYLINPKDKSRVSLFRRTVMNQLDQSPKAYDFEGRMKDEVSLDCGDAKILETKITGMTAPWAASIVRIMNDRKIGGTRFDSYDSLLKYSLNGKRVFSDQEVKDLKKVIEPSHVKLYKVK